MRPYPPVKEYGGYFTEWMLDRYCSFSTTIHLVRRKNHLSDAISGVNQPDRLTNCFC